MVDLADELQQIIDAYDHVIREIDEQAHSSETDRAYGGIVRAGKGKLHETITKQIIFLAWKKLQQDASRLKVEHQITQIPINKEYLKRIQNPEIKTFLERHISDFTYPLGIDWTVLIANKDSSGFKPILGVECKAYTENAMLKRILVDCSLLKSIYPSMGFILVQLESQLGGDYSELNPTTYGSSSTHTLFSHFDIDLQVITLLKGERKVDRPIHNPEYYKPLERVNLERAISQISEILKGYV